MVSTSFDSKGLCGLTTMSAETVKKAKGEQGVFFNAHFEKNILKEFEYFHSMILHFI